MTSYSAGDVALVPFPFTDLSTTKKRPALILATAKAPATSSLVIVAMITSRLEGEILPGDCEIAGWKEAGLIHPSKVRLSKLVSLEESLVLRRLGALLDNDRGSIGKELQSIFSAWLPPL